MSKKIDLQNFFDQIMSFEKKETFKKKKKILETLTHKNKKTIKKNDLKRSRINNNKKQNCDYNFRKKRKNSRENSRKKRDENNNFNYKSINHNKIFD